jgi:hypothetical protein
MSGSVEPGSQRTIQALLFLMDGVKQGESLAIGKMAFADTYLAIGAENGR